MKLYRNPRYVFQDLKTTMKIVNKGFVFLVMKFLWSLLLEATDPTTFDFNKKFTPRNVYIKRASVLFNFFSHVSVTFVI